MKRDNVIKDKSKSFALRIVKLYQYLRDEKKEFVLSKQVLRSGTSIGANIAEAICSFSDKEFLAKAYIAFKECSETQFWIELLHDSDLLTDIQFESIHNESEELRKILSSITKTMREKVKANS